MSTVSIVLGSSFTGARVVRERAAVYGRAWWYDGLCGTADKCRPVMESFMTGAAIAIRREVLLGYGR
jgi:hypothetical protein